MQITPGAVAIANRQVNLALREIHQAVLGGDVDTDVGMAIGEPAQPRDQPFGGETGEGRDGQNTRLVAPEQVAGDRSIASRALVSAGR